LLQNRPVPVGLQPYRTLSDWFYHRDVTRHGLASDACRIQISSQNIRASRKASKRSAIRPISIQPVQFKGLHKFEGLG